MVDSQTRRRPATEPIRSLEELRAEISVLTDANRTERSVELERRLLSLRHQAGIELVRTHQGSPAADYPEAGDERLLGGSAPAEIAPQDLTPSLLRAAILRDGCAIVRGLIDRAEALSFADEIERAYQERDRKLAGDKPDPAYYEEFQPSAAFQRPRRGWVKEGGGLPAADSPKLSFRRMEMMQSAGIPELAAGYLGEPAAFSIQKTTLRKIPPTLQGAWHQDGSFMGRVRSINLWIALSRCGDEAPGLDIVARRLDGLVATGTEGAVLPMEVSQAVAEDAAGEHPIVRPIFEPGDAVLFDEICLHKTASDPAMTHARFAVESWFFAPSSMPTRYAPMAV